MFQPIAQYISKKMRLKLLNEIVFKMKHNQIDSLLQLSKRQLELLEKIYHPKFIKLTSFIPLKLYNTTTNQTIGLKSFKFAKSSVTVISGCSGAGKTTLLFKLAYKSYNQGYIPIFVPLKSYKSKSIKSYLSKTFTLVKNNLFKSSLQDGKIILFFDGLNELKNQLIFSNQLLQFITEYSDCPIIISSRYNVENIPLDTNYEILPLDEETKYKFIKKQFTTDADKIINLLESTESIKALTETPLFLTICCKALLKDWIKSSTNVSSVSFYDLIISEFLENWETQEGKSLLTDSQWIKLLSKLAFKLNQSCKLTFKKALVEETLDEIFEKSLLASKIANNLKEIIQQITNCTFFHSINDNYFFIHQSFQDFFAGKYLSENPKKITNGLSSIWWDEALIFAMDYLQDNLLQQIAILDSCFDLKIYAVCASCLEGKFGNSLQVKIRQKMDRSFADGLKVITLCKKWSLWEVEYLFSVIETPTSQLIEILLKENIFFKILHKPVELYGKDDICKLLMVKIPRNRLEKSLWHSFEEKLNLDINLSESRDLLRKKLRLLEIKIKTSNRTFDNFFTLCQSCLKKCFSTYKADSKYLSFIALMAKLSHNNFMLEYKDILEQSCPNGILAIAFIFFLREKNNRIETNKWKSHLEIALQNNPLDSTCIDLLIQLVYTNPPSMTHDFAEFLKFTNLSQQIIKLIKNQCINPSLENEKEKYKDLKWVFNELGTPSDKQFYRNWLIQEYASKVPQENNNAEEIKPSEERKQQLPKPIQVSCPSWKEDYLVFTSPELTNSCELHGFEAKLTYHLINFAKNKKKLKTPEVIPYTILLKFWNDNNTLNSNVLNDSDNIKKIQARITSVRKKLSSTFGGKTTQWIKAKPKIGYRWAYTGQITIPNIHSEAPMIPDRYNYNYKNAYSSPNIKKDKPIDKW